MASLAQYKDLKVLVAEDHPANRRLVDAILQSLGIQASIVGNGAEALAAMEHGSFDLILTDINMPVMDGLTLIRTIRGVEKREGRPRARIHVISSMSEPADLFASRLAGADGHVTKPMLLSSFIGAVDDGLRWLRRRKDGRAAQASMLMRAAA